MSSATKRSPSADSRSRRWLPVGVAVPLLGGVALMPVLMNADEAQPDGPELIPDVYQTASLSVPLDDEADLPPTIATSLPDSLTDLELPRIGSVDDAAEWNGETVVEGLSGQIDRIEAALATIREAAGYTATMIKQERIEGVLNEAETIALKIRREPFSVYMRWETGDRGREALYIDGKNNNELLVHPGGWKGRFVPTMSIDPNGSLARTSSRHSIADAGVENLLRKHLDHRIDSLEHGDTMAETRHVTVDGERFIEMTIVYSDQSRSPEYRKSVLRLDPESGLPVVSLNYGWTSTDAAGELASLVERYEYRHLNRDAVLGADDFDRENRRYSLGR